MADQVVGRERERATRNILEIISQSRDDERPVFDVILESACRLCDAPLALIGMVDEATNQARYVASSGATPRFENAMKNYGLPMDDERHGLVRAIKRNELVQVVDARDSDLYRNGDPGRTIPVDIEGVRTFLVAPLVSQDRHYGAIVLYRREVRVFTEDHITLLQTFAEQATIAIENVRQFKQVQNRYEREAATREILQAISRSRGEFEPVFDVILDNASRLCEAPMAMMLMCNEARTHMYIPAHRGSRAGYVDLINKNPPQFDPKVSSTAEAIHEMKIVQVPDFADDRIYHDGQEHRVAAVELEGIRTFLAVPLVRGEQSIGAICLYRRDVKPFSDDQVDLVRTFAEQAVIAVENVRQFKEVETRLEREGATREILEVISRSRDNEAPVFDTILKSALRLCDVDMSVLVMLNREETHLELIANAGASFLKLKPGEERWPVDSDLTVARAVRERRNIVTEDLRDEVYHRGDPTRVALVEKEGMRSQLVIPLLAGERAIGSFVLQRREMRSFTQDEINLLQSFAAQAVIAIENVSQFKALENLNAELSSRVDEQVREIERMARLKRFLPAAVADTVVSQGSETALRSHRALLGVLFCDIRGFTAFCETAEPEETIELLQTYHEEMGKLVNSHAAGVDHRMGDGIMVLFNDPLPCDDPAGDAVRLAIAMRSRMAELGARWKRLGYRLGFGVGISLGYATVGMVGFEGRFDYTASGTAINLAARLCDEAEDGEILLSPRACVAVEDTFRLESRGDISLKGIREPVEVFRLASSTAL